MTPARAKYSPDRKMRRVSNLRALCSSVLSVFQRTCRRHGAGGARCGAIRRVRGTGVHLTDFEAAVRASIRRRGLFGGVQRLVVAVSGGPDSMALFFALLRIGRASASGPELVVAHLDHGLRPSSADDASFVAHAAANAGVDAVVERIDVAAEAASRRENIEAVGRAVRYGFLARVAGARRAEAVATGHTATDQAETVVMRLARGTGIDGLAGIAASRELAAGTRLVRPMIDATRDDVLDYCQDREIRFLDDATNRGSAPLARLRPTRTPAAARACFARRRGQSRPCRTAGRGRPHIFFTPGRRDLRGVGHRPGRTGRASRGQRRGTRAGAAPTCHSRGRAPCTWRSRADRAGTYRGNRRASRDRIGTAGRSVCRLACGRAGSGNRSLWTVTLKCRRFPPYNRTARRKYHFETPLQGGFDGREAAGRRHRR